MVYEGAAEIREIGVGITLLRNAMRELAGARCPARAGSRFGTRELCEACSSNRWASHYREPRGRHGGNALPRIGIAAQAASRCCTRRGAALVRGRGSTWTNRCPGVEQRRRRRPRCASENPPHQCRPMS
jgi:hypothetical protein